jgi:uncharacterized protein CbrC (UPF0167 family)
MSEKGKCNRRYNKLPVMKCDSREARYDTKPATSSGFPMYPQAVFFLSCRKGQASFGYRKGSRYLIEKLGCTPNFISYCPGCIADAFSASQLRASFIKRPTHACFDCT